MNATQLASYLHIKPSFCYKLCKSRGLAPEFPAEKVGKMLCEKKLPLYPSLNVLLAERNANRTKSPALCERLEEAYVAASDGRFSVAARTLNFARITWPKRWNADLQRALMLFEMGGAPCVQ